MCRPGLADVTMMCVCLLFSTPGVQAYCYRHPPADWCSIRINLLVTELLLCSPVCSVACQQQPVAPCSILLSHLSTHDPIPDGVDLQATSSRCRFCTSRNSCLLLLLVCCKPSCSLNQLLAAFSCELIRRLQRWEVGNLHSKPGRVFWSRLAAGHPTQTQGQQKHG